MGDGNLGGFQKSRIAKLHVHLQWSKIRSTPSYHGVDFAPNSLYKRGMNMNFMDLETK